MVALDLIQKNKTVDDYDVVTYSECDYDDIAIYKLPILAFVRKLYSKYTSIDASIDVDNIKIYTPHSLCNFSFVLSETMAFSGTIGITDINKDFGLSKHLNYLSMFVDQYKIDRMVSQYDLENEIQGEEVDELLTAYRQLYIALSDYFNSDYMSLYSLLTGIKQHYNIPDVGVLLDNENYVTLDMTKLKNPSFINDYSRDVKSEVLPDSPTLKVVYKGNKLLHIRTKMDTKNNNYKLRFFIETTTKFLNLFKTHEDLV